MVQIKNIHGEVILALPDGEGWRKVDFDLTTPVSVTGNDKLWVVWTANTTLSNFPAGCTDVNLVEEGTWWNAGYEAGYEWEHATYGTWTMRQYFTNSEGRTVILGNVEVKTDIIPKTRTKRVMNSEAVTSTVSKMKK